MFNEKQDVKIPEGVEVEKVATPAGLTVDQLLRMLIDQGKETAASNKALADAILESRKPYVDPRVIADREQRQKDRSALVNMELRNRAFAKRACPHLNEGGKLNIKWMQHSNGIILGVCGSCKSEFDATHNKDDAKFLMQDPKSLRNMGRAGDHAKRGVDIAM